jgi:hypothetical protein
MAHTTGRSGGNIKGGGNTKTLQATQCAKQTATLPSSTVQSVDAWPMQL